MGQEQGAEPVAGGKSSSRGQTQEQEQGAAVLPSRKSDQEISKTDFYQTIFLPENKPTRLTR